MTDFELTKCCALFEFGCSNAAAKAVLVCLAAKSRNGAVEGYTSDTLARICCVQRHAFLKAVSWLEEQGLIFVKRHAGVKSTFTFNEPLIASKTLLGAESVTEKVNVESDTECRIQQEKLSVESVTDSVSNPSLNQCRIHNSISVESDTTYKKEKEKKEKEDFSSMTDSELIDFFSAVSHEDGIEARAEYTRRVLARNKQTMRPDFEQPDRPQYEILGMHH